MTDPAGGPSSTAAGEGPDPMETAPLEIIGRLTEASNLTLFCFAVADGARVPCVYKPVLGERPLWDFPDGTLAAREYASYLISESLGWPLIPKTVLRAGPHGEGMVQRWIGPTPPGAAPHDPTSDGNAAVDSDPVADSGPAANLVDLFPAGSVPASYFPVFDGEDAAGRRVVLAHRDHPLLERIAVLDVLLNNPDRKGGHVLPGPGGAVHAIDHGICLHAEPKLRTILWGWAGRPVPPARLADIRSFARALDEDTPLTRSLDGLLTVAELQALRTRSRRLLADGTMPVPSGGHVIPWPPL